MRTYLIRALGHVSYLLWPSKDLLTHYLNPLIALFYCLSRSYLRLSASIMFNGFLVKIKYLDI